MQAQDDPQEEMQISNGGFTKNMGQLLDFEGTVTNEPKFYAKHGSQYYYLLDNKVAYAFSSVNTENNEETLFRVDMEFTDANATGEIREGEQLYYKNYYLHYTPADGITDVGVYNDLTIENIWEGIDVKYTLGSGLGYEFYLHSEAAPELIKLNWTGIANIETNDEDNIFIVSEARIIEWGKPTAYQIINNERVDVEIGAVVEDNQIHFELSDYDHSQPLILGIGPMPIRGESTIQHWSTFINGGSADVSNDVSIDANNNVYSCGRTSSSVYPVVGGQFLSYTLGGDAYVFKFNANRGIAWGSYFGGSGIDYGLHVESNAAGYVYMAGNTTSGNIPACATCNASVELKDNTFNGLIDLFVSKFNSTGKLGVIHPGTFATYFGGTGSEELHGMTIDNAGNLYLGGVVFQTGFATFPVKNLSGAYNRTHNFVDGGNNGFISKINSSNILTWSTAIGGNNAPVGSENEEITGMTTDASGNLYVTGTCGSYGTFLSPPVTSSPAATFPLVDPAGTLDFCRDISIGITPPNPDALVMKFSSSGAIVWSTLFGGTGTENFHDYAHNNNAIAVDAAGNIFITGTTRSTVSGANAPLFPYKALTGINKYNQPLFGGGAGVDDAFIAWFSPQYELKWSTFYGGVGSDVGLGVAVSSLDNNLYFTGGTTSPNFPIKPLNGSYNQLNIKGGSDAYLLKFSTAADRHYAMWYGGSEVGISEEGKSIATDNTGDNVIICGVSGSTDFPWRDIPGSLDYFYGANAGGGDAFISNLQNICLPCLRMAAPKENIFGEVQPAISPNPSSQFIKINFSDVNTFENVTIFNNNGVKVKEFANQSSYIFIGDLDVGIYALKFSNNGKLRVIKFIVSK